MSKTPALLPVQVADLCGGAWPAAVQILAALIRQRETGVGSTIDVSMTDGAHAMLAMPLAKFSADQATFGQGRDLLSGGVPCYDVYATRDGHLAVGALEAKFWYPLVKKLGLPHLSNPKSQYDSSGSVRAELQQLFSQHTTQHWMQILEGSDVAVDAVVPPEDISKSDPQLASRDLYVDIVVPCQPDSDGELKDSAASSTTAMIGVATTPSSLSSSSARILKVPKTPLRMEGVVHDTQPGPRLGQHTQDILRELEAHHEHRHRLLSKL